MRDHASASRVTMVDDSTAPDTSVSDAPIPFAQDARAALHDTQLRTALSGLASVARERRQLVLASTEEWESLRDRARAIKDDALLHLDRYLEQFVMQAEAAGATIHRAQTAADARDIVIALARQYDAPLVVKSKSMLSEELELNHALEAEGITPIETDLGEWIVQLAHETPSHIVLPAIHKTRADIARLFARTLGTPDDADAATLTRAARRELRSAFATARMGISGVNFAVAETGSLLILENEGNARLTTSVPPVHVALMGIEKVIPRLADLDVFLKLLPRAGTGQRLTSYQSILTGTAAPGEGPEALHIVIVDNGRSRMLHHPLTRQSLACIRCGACLNVCPVYQQVGGHAYGSVYPGPIGAVITPQLTGLGHAAQLPFASSLCGACRDVCPVKIDIPALLLHLRAQIADGTEADHAGADHVKADHVKADHNDDVPRQTAKRFTFRLWRWAMQFPWAYRVATGAGRLGQRVARLILGPHWARRVGRVVPPLAQWTAERDLRPLAPRSFRAMWAQSERATSEHTTSDERQR